MGSDSSGLNVTGGSGGLRARTDDLRALATHSEHTAEVVTGVLAAAHARLVAPEMAAAATLDPAGAARFAAALTSALDGRDGVAALAASLASRAAGIRASAASYDIVDSSQKAAFDDISWFTGLVAPATPVAALLTMAIGDMDPRTGRGFDLQRTMVEYPGFVDLVAATGPGLTTLAGIATSSPEWARGPGDVPGAAGLLGRAYPDGEPHVERLASAPSDDPFAAPSGRRAGTGDDAFERVLGGLSDTNDASHAPRSGPQPLDDTQGTVTVRTIRRPGHETVYLVDVPGTKDWHAKPGPHDQINDLGTNLHALADDTTTYQRGIAEALRQAGAPPNAPVALDGHSQGGMVITQLSRDSGTSSFPYRVTHVITAGSPTSRMDVPSGVQMLNLENDVDIVPRLDGRPENPDTPNRTTVTFHRQTGTVVGNHDMRDTYLPEARALDTSKAPSVVAFRESMSAYLDPRATIETQRYRITRRNG